MPKLKNEPVAFSAGILSLVNALFLVLLQFKVPITGEQQTAVMGLLVIGLGLWTRGKVSPVAGPKTPTIPPGVAGMFALVSTVVMCFAFFMACGRSADARPPQCPDKTLAELDAAYFAEAAAACKLEDAGVNSCKALPEIKARHLAQVKAWQECSR